MEDQTRNSIGLAAVAGVAVGAASIFVGNRIVSMTFDAHDCSITPRLFAPQKEGMPPFPIADDNMRMAVERNVAAIMADVESWKAQTTIERVVRTVDEGTVKLVGYLYYNARPSRRWVVLAHGYRGDHLDMERYAKYYADEGFNVFIPDLRSLGESEGRYIGMGWTDADDLLDWVVYLMQRFGSDIDIVLHGHSMGAATVLTASSRCPYPQVRAIIADSSYTGVWDILASVMRAVIHVPVHPLLDLANLAFKARGGYDLHRASIADAVRWSAIPTFIIHGADDSFVPPSMAPKLFGACGAIRKELRIVPNAGHAMSQLVDPEAYRDMVKAFIMAASR